ncbi:MAG: pilin [Patescibacteria group bacterium]|nr:pilin [Patescibacteria group bacterium]
MFNLIGKAYALPSLPNLGNFVVSPSGNSISAIITRVLGFVLLIAGAIAVIYLIYGGLLYITAGGDAEKATKGRTALVNAIIGIVIIALAYVIVGWVGNIILHGTA